MRRGGILKNALNYFGFQAGWLACVMGAGLYAYRGAPAEWLAPAWIVALWILLAATFDASLVWLERRPWLCAVIGAAASPFSFTAGMRLGAAELAVPAPQGYIALSALWFVALPLSFAVAKFAEGRKS